MSVTAKAETLSATIADAIGALAAETDAAKQDVTFRTWLTTMSRFYTYSFGNQLLIAAQCSTATRVAGYGKWLEMKRQVRKGEKAIYILAPIIGKDKEPTTENGEVRRLRGFRAATVFDIAQTEGEELPKPPSHDAAGGGDDLLPKVETAIRNAGIALVYKVITSGAQGFSKGGTIEIDERQGIAAKCGTLVHEFAHELLHREDRSQGKQQRELEAEAVAYAVLTHYDLHPGSRFYLASYGITGEMLTASMQTIAKTARQIIEKIEAKGEGKETEGDSALPLAA
jgi:antirestriction protein ArdC